MGAINLDNTGSGSAVTLSSDGTALLLNGSAVGGGGGGGASAITISNKTAAYTVVAGDLGTIINCTSGTFTVSLTDAATLGTGFNVTVWNTGTGTITIATNGTDQLDGAASTARPILYSGQGVMLVCNGTAWNTAFGRTNQILSFKSLNTAGGSRGYPLASNSYAIALGQTNTNNSNVVASGVGAVAIGINSNFSQGSQATNSGATALGGSYASGVDSFAAAVASNSSGYGAKASNALAIGFKTTAGATNSIALGYFAYASAQRALALGGTATAINSIAIGENATSNAIRGVAFQNGNTRYYGHFVHSPFSSTNGGQSGVGVFFSDTTAATATVLAADNTTAGATNQVILLDNSAYAFTGTVVSKKSGSTDVAAWKVEGVIVRGANAASTTLVASTVTAISNVPGWTLALSVDTTNGGLAVTFTGAAATNIRTVATIQTSEVTYA